MADLAMLWAALASAGTSMILGFLWFGPLFGKAWLKAMGKDTLSDKELEEMRKTAGPGYILSILFAAGVSILVYAILFEWDFYAKLDELPNEWVAGAFIGAVGGVGFFLPAALVNSVFTGMMKEAAISIPYWVIQLSLYGLWAGFFGAL